MLTEWQLAGMIKKWQSLFSGLVCLSKSLVFFIPLL